MYFLYIKALHLIAVVCWFAGLFYLPRLFVYHSMATEKTVTNYFKVMEKRLYYFIMTPAAILTIGLGEALILYNPSFYLNATWMHLKLIGVGLLIIFHLYCGYLCLIFSEDKNTHSHRFYRFYNEIPTLLLIAIVLLVIVKPNFYL